MTTYNATKLYGQEVWLARFKRYQAGPTNADWAERFAAEQRSAKEQGKLHPKRIEMLNAIGFNFAWPPPLPVKQAVRRYWSPKN